MKLKQLRAAKPTGRNVADAGGSPKHGAKFAELEALYAAIVSKPPSRSRIKKFHAGQAGGRAFVARSKAVVTAFWQACRRHHRAIALAVGGPSLAGVLLFAAVMLFLPQSIHYAFASQKNCVGSPAIFPSLLKTDSQGAFTLTRASTVSVGHTPVFSYRLCATPAREPRASTRYVDHQWVSIAGWHAGKSIRVITPGYPVAFAASLGAKAVPIKKPLLFKLNLADTTFDYDVAANGQTSPCSKQKTALSCNLAPLKLAYAASYKASLVRMFHGRAAGTVLSKTLRTITATSISQTSVGAGSTVYDQPQQFTLQTSKTITALQTVALTTKNADGSVTNIPITSSFSGQTITVSAKSPLPRKATFDLRINNLTATDDSSLEQPYDLSFTTSGGPKVTGVNIPAYGLASGQSIVVTLDQALGANQDPSQLASLLVNGTKQPAAISLSGKQLVIKPAASFPVCATVTVQLTAAAQNLYGVAGDSAWSYGSRAHCYTTYSIGTSVNGRPITAYQFGSGPSMVLYIAAMEGNEQNSAELLAQWIPDIDANPGKIPTGRTIVIIPQINPDGFAADTRTNAAAIDLNRNFPANNWQTQVTEPLANTVMTDDGGPNPLSAPESQALANFYEANHPRLTLTMHSHGAIVEANDAGDSDALGAIYAAKAGYRAIPTSAIGNFFDYTTTGAFEDWARDKIGLPVLEIELQSPTAVEYSRNLPALWAMAQVSP